MVPEYKNLIMGISDKYFGAYYKDAIEKHIRGGKGYRADLIMETIGMSE